LSKKPTQTKSEFSFYTATSLRRKNFWLVNLRWFATVLLLIFSVWLIQIKLNNYPYHTIGLVGILLAGANLLVFLYLKLYNPTSLAKEEKIVIAQIVIDYIFLTYLIHLTGGIDSPFHFFYLFHIIIASVIFENKIPALIISALAVLIFTILVALEYFAIIPHHCNCLKAFAPIDIVFVLSAFYATIIASTYIGLTLMMRHKKVKNLIYVQKEELEKSDKAKMQFFRFVSHELKSPIIAVQSSINVVLDIMGGDLKQQAKNMLERGRKRTAQMIEILKDLVSLSYDDHETQQEPELITPCDHMPEVIDQFRPSAVDKKIKLIENICQERVGFKLDKFTFEKILTNLLSNAIRYTPSGGSVTISTELDEKYWYLKIADTGIGIPQEDQKLIFNEFYRASNAKKFEEVGTGLGMSIIKRMVEQENGEIYVESELGKGSTFTVRFLIK